VVVKHAAILLKERGFAVRYRRTPSVSSHAGFRGLLWKVEKTIIGGEEACAVFWSKVDLGVDWAGRGTETPGVGLGLGWTDCPGFRILRGQNPRLYCIFEDIYMSP
jgi:hypothetical protein